MHTPVNPWETLEQRRKNHRLTLFYKMRYSLTPQYLSSLVPESISNVSNYNLRHSNNPRGINARTTQYQQSFLPTAIKEWNILPLEFQQSNSVNSFKYNLTKDKEQTRNTIILAVAFSRSYTLVCVLTAVLWIWICSWKMSLKLHCVVVVVSRIRSIIYSIAHITKLNAQL